MRPNRNHLSAQLPNPRRQRARKMRQRLRESSFAARGDQVSNRLRLRKIDSSIQKRTPSKFTRLSQPRTKRGRERDDPPHDKRSAVTLYLDHILARETPRQRHSNSQRTIHGYACRRIDNVAKPQPPRRKLAATHRPKDRTKDFKSPRPRQTNDRNRPSPRRSSRRNNRISDVHQQRVARQDGEEGEKIWMRNLTQVSRSFYAACGRAGISR